MEENISAEFPFESKFVEVNGSKMHYIDVGEGDPVLFLHGNPTSSYLWRNVIPHVQGQARCIAPDLIGMGKSDKPDIGYTYDDHYEYLKGFIQKLGLKNVTLVLHDWGSGLGFRYAHEHQDNVKQIAFMESMIRPMKSEDLPKEARAGFMMMRLSVIGDLMLSVGNMFVTQLLPQMIVRKLTKEEFDYYKAPYKTIKSRKPVRVWPQQVPIDGKPKRSVDLIGAYGKWLETSELPKLFFYVSPGAILQEKDIEFVKTTYRNTKSIDLGEGKHFIQEDHPHAIGKGISEWLLENSKE